MQHMKLLNKQQLQQNVVANPVANTALAYPTPITNKGYAMTNEESYKSVLLVSDNQVDIQYIESKFMDTGGLVCKLFRCSLLSAALEQLGNKKLNIDVIIIDLRLKEAEDPSGFYKTIKNAAPHIPVIVLTGLDKNQHTQAASLIAAGASAHIHRENFNILYSLIRSALFPGRG
jgi:CheY-like chemotaxis protein